MSQLYRDTITNSIKMKLPSKYTIRKAIRRACQSGILRFRFPPEFPIRTCLQWYLYRHERATVDYLKRNFKDGSVFVDIGAHIMYFVVYDSKLVRQKG